MTWRSKFQSTHPHGVRRVNTELWSGNLHSFNPRTRTGCDLRNRQPKQKEPQFQSTHPHGVRLEYCMKQRQRLTSFNPRTRTGCDRRFYVDEATTGTFQSTHPHGVRHRPVNTLISQPLFQSTHPHGVRPVVLASWMCLIPSFNPRTRTGCDLRSEALWAEAKEFQSTHPHGVRPAHLRMLESLRRVSIHAPARGATTIVKHKYPNIGVSIHAPARGATCQMMNYQLRVMFQSTHPHGVRR